MQITPKGFLSLSLDTSEFPKLVISTKDVSCLEDKGKTILTGVYSIEQLKIFIQKVCNWGNYPGIAERIFKDNSLDSIKKAFDKCIIELKQSDPVLTKAMIELNNIKNLGKPSFSSKHMRFLRPDICPVFDSIIIENSSYINDELDYSEFATECSRIAAVLEGLKIHNPRNRPNGRWYAADVEVAIYRYLKL